MADFMKHILSKPIQLAEVIKKSVEQASCFKDDCYELKIHTEKLSQILRQLMALSVSVPYQRSVRKILNETEQVLNNTLSLVLKCHSNGHRKRILGKSTGVDLKEISRQLKKSLSDVIRLHDMLLLHDETATGLDLMVVSPIRNGDDFDFITGDDSDLIFINDYVNLHLRQSAIDDDDLYIDSVHDAIQDNCHSQSDLPLSSYYSLCRKNIILYSNSYYIDLLRENLDVYNSDSEEEKRLWHIWPLIDYLFNNSLYNRLFGASFLLLLSEKDDRYKTLIIEEGGVLPLLRLLQMGSVEEQQITAKVIGNLAYDSKSAQHILDSGVCLEFVKLLKEGTMKVQAEVAWSISRLAANCSIVQDNFALFRNIMRLLINHLAFEIVEDHIENATLINKATSVLAIVMAKSHLNISDAIERYDDDGEIQKENFSHSNKDRELEEPNTKAHLKAMAARALCILAKGNPSICRSICESRALICFVILLDKGFNKVVRYNSAKAIMEITSVVENDADLRRYAFRPSSPTCKALINQLVNVLESEADSEHLLNICIKAIGNLGKTFREVQTRVISSLLDRLVERSLEVQKAAITTLTKFVCKNDHLRIDHSESIISADGEKNLVQLVSSGEPTVQRLSLHLLCYVAIYVSDVKSLVEAKVLDVLKWASKQSYLTRDDDTLDSLLPLATSRLARAV